MQDGWITVAAGAVTAAPGDVVGRCRCILEQIREAQARQVDVLLLPELCLTGASCLDLLAFDALLQCAQRCLADVVAATAGTSVTVVFGTPILGEGRLYSCAAVASGGRLLGLVSAGASATASCRYFSRYTGGGTLRVGNECVPIGEQLLFAHAHAEQLRFAVVMGASGGDVLGTALEAVRGGATLLLHPTAQPHTVGATERWRQSVCTLSSQLHCAVVVAGADASESVTDHLCAGQAMIAEDGALLQMREPFAAAGELLVTQIDTAALSHRIRCTGAAATQTPWSTVLFDTPLRKTQLTRRYSQAPFLPADDGALRRRAEEIVTMQAQALARRVTHVGASCAVVGISGGLDSTLALLVAVRAMQRLRRSPADVLAVTMPGFGTTTRTENNATSLARALGVTLRCIDITSAAGQHLADIGHDGRRADVTFENAQARERTQILMDLANLQGGMVVGTGDLSELALGFATYNGDHMSMYGVNASLPKTLMRAVVLCEAEAARERGEQLLAQLLADVVHTPVSPELLPTDDKGNSPQLTESVVGPYELHDFFLYHMLRYGATPRKLLRLAENAFAERYDRSTIAAWLRVFLRRFVSQQFKRSCLPDGISIGSISLSPRSSWQMPSDMSATVLSDDLAAQL